jgi:DNA-binding MarR family transcriptional regulator
MATLTLEEILALTDNRLSTTMNRMKAELLGLDDLARLTVTQMMYVHVIAGLGRPTLSELANRLHVSKPSVTAVVQKLIQGQYLEKHRSSEDLRVFNLELTEKGRRVIQVKEKTFRTFADRVRAALSEAEVLELERLLGKALQTLEPD